MTSPLKMFSKPAQADDTDISVALVDDHELIHMGVKSVLDGEEGIRIDGEGYCGDHVWEIVNSLKPDVILLDVEMPQEADDRTSRFRAIQTVRTLVSDYLTKPLILSHKDDPTLIRLLYKAGVQGFIHKEDIYGSSRNLPNAIRTIARSTRRYYSDLVQDILEDSNVDLTDIPALTPRRIEILQFVADNADLTYEQIAQKMGLSRSTVNNTMTAVSKALGATNKLETVVMAAKLGIITL